QLFFMVFLKAPLQAGGWKMVTHTTLHLRTSRLRQSVLYSDWLKHFVQTESFTLCQGLARPATLSHTNLDSVRQMIGRLMNHWWEIDRQNCERRCQGIVMHFGFPLVLGKGCRTVPHKPSLPKELVFQ
ncbi:hypothetical protein GOODEAATRI_004537, partial [Goodea atripinnis]